MGYTRLVESKPWTLKEYETVDGRSPFREWLNGLKDVEARARIRVGLNRLRIGNPGKRRSVGQGVWEMKIDFGPGYRVYYGEDGQIVVILLCGGDKSRQKQDIQRAHEFWCDYQSP